MLISFWNKHLIIFYKIEGHFKRRSKSRNVNLKKSIFPCLLKKKTEIIWKRYDFSKWYGITKPITMVIIVFYQNDVQSGDKRIPIMMATCITR